MKIMKRILLLPVLPIYLGWKWSSGAKATSAGALFSKKDALGREIIVEHGGCLPRLIGTAIIAGILYSLVVWGVKAVLGACGVQV